MAAVRALLVLLVLLLPTLPAADVVPQPKPEAGSLQGQFLIASPQIGDPRFARTVILMVRHDRTGAFGLIINRPIEERSIASLLAATGRPSEGVTGSVRVYAGGPVELGAGFILHTTDYRAGGETFDIDGRMAMSSNPDVLRDIGLGKGPAKHLFVVGYAGWGPGQLEGEMARRDWFTAPASLRLVFDESRETLWDLAVSQRTRDL